MAFTNVWSNTTPPDSQLADALGADIRQLRLDVAERMNAALVVDWTADPLVLQDSVKGLATGLQRIIPFSAFLGDLHAKENDISDGQLNGFVGNDLFAPVMVVPNGCVVTLVEWLLDKQGSTSIDCSLRKRAFGPGTPGAATVVSTININTAGAAIKPSAALTETIDANSYYYLQLHGNGGAGTSYIVYAVRITFNRPSLANG